jgi:hypothetical protein
MFDQISHDLRRRTRLWNPLSFDSRSRFHSLLLQFLNFSQFNVLDLGHYFVHHYYLYLVKLVVARNANVNGLMLAVATTEQDYNICLAAEQIFGANFKFLVEIDGELLLVKFVGGAGRFSFF